MSLLSKFAGIAAGPAKNLLSLLAPLILSTIAKQLSGKSLTPATLSGFFAEQAPHINAALPPGFSLANIPGFSTATTAPKPAASTAPAESSGLPGWLLPLVGLALLGGLAWYFFGGQPAVQVEPAAPVVNRTDVPKPDVPKVDVPKVNVAVPALPDTAKLGTDLTGIFTSLTDILGGVKDVPTAETAAPKLTELPTKLDGIKALWDKLPDAGKSAITKIAVDHLGQIKDLVTKVLAIPGVSEKLKPVLDTILAKLTAFTVK